MQSHQRALVLATTVGTLVFASAWAAEMFVRGPRVLEETPRISSRVAAAGDIVAWIEVPAFGGQPVLAVRGLDSEPATRVPIPDMDRAEADAPFAWLADGPEASVGCSGACVRVAFVGNHALRGATLYVWNATTAQWSNVRSSTPLYGAAIDADDVFLSRDAADGPDIYRVDINDGMRMTPLIVGVGRQIMPAASGGYVLDRRGPGRPPVPARIAWLQQPEPPVPGSAVASLFVGPSTGGNAIEVSREAWLVDPVIDGDRVLWVGPFGAGAALHVFDIVSRQDGILASDPRPCPQCGATDYLRGDLSAELIAHAGRDQMLHVYDARALTSVGNLGSYLTEFTSVRTTTAAAAPAVDKAHVLWSEPFGRGVSAGGAALPDVGLAGRPETVAATLSDTAEADQPGLGAAWRIQLLEASRGRLLLPRVHGRR